MQAFDALAKRWIRNQLAGGRRYADATAEAAKRHIKSMSGELADSIKVEDHLGEDPPWLEVGAFEQGAANAHGIHEEFGTSRESPHPFMRPALEEAVGEFRVDE